MHKSSTQGCLHLSKPRTDLHDCLVVIPARLTSTRLPEKPLQDLEGKALIVRTHDAVLPLATHGATVIVATDSDKIKKTCDKAGISCQMTSTGHESGTDRTWEVAARFPNHGLILNVQGDEPFIKPEVLLRLVAAFRARPTADIATLVVPRQDFAAFHNANIVKAVRGQDDFALYFTRAPAPYPRDDLKSGSFLHHQGVYLYRRAALERFCQLPPSPLETTEKLEQLRALEAGMRLLLVESHELGIGIDTPEDLEAARARYR